MPECPFNTRATMVIAVATLLASCASQPDPLSSVRARMDAARADENIRAHAPGSLGDAQRTLALAAEADEDDLRDHLIYLTERNLDIAGAVAERRRAESELDALRGRHTAHREAAPPRPAGTRSGEVTPSGIDARRQAEPPVSKVPNPAQEPVIAGTKVTPRAGSNEPASATILRIPNLSFDSGSVQLTPEAMESLQGLVSSLQLDPELRVLVEGHSDSNGSTQQNLQMSLARAKSIKAYLLEQGIASHRVQTLGQGAKYPVANNATEEGRSRNRRVEIALYRVPDPIGQDARRP